MNKITEFVAEIVKDFLQQDDCGWKSELELKSYTRASAKEILKELYRYEDLPPLVVLENFRDKMNEYSRLNSRNSMIFSVGSKTAEYFINLLV